VQTALVGIAITPTAGEGYYIPIGNGEAGPESAPTDLLCSMNRRRKNKPLTIHNSQFTIQCEASLWGNYHCKQCKRPSPPLADAAITKYMHNAKFDMTVLQRHGLPVASPIFDTMIATWVSNNAPGARYGLKDLTRERLNIQMTEIKELIGSGKNQITMAQVPIEQATPYAAADVDMTLRLADEIEQTLAVDEQLAYHFHHTGNPADYRTQRYGIGRYSAGY
jgi:DNA polymerase I-like protein with 3'-5' exonuclease and polymerase domains